MSTSEHTPFDVAAYLQAELPGFEFQIATSVGMGGLEIVRARASFKLGVHGELDSVRLPVPDRELARKHWADEIIKSTRHEASLKLGLDKVWQEMQLSLKQRYEHEMWQQQQEATRRIEQEVGKAYLAGKAAGYGEGIASMIPDEDDDE